jgi:hypothetical protein
MRECQVGADRSRWSRFFNGPEAHGEHRLKLAPQRAGMLKFG